MPHAVPDALADDEIEQVLPGGVLIHVVTVVTRDQLSIVIETLQAVQASGGGLELLHLRRRGDRLDHQLKIAGLRPHKARLLLDRLALLAGVERATIEYRILNVVPVAQKIDLPRPSTAAASPPADGVHQIECPDIAAPALKQVSV